MEYNLTSFGMLLQNERKKRGLSQEKLAELADLHRTYISDLERGIRNPTITTIFTLCKALNTTPSELLKGFENE
ncbi:MAG: helix-turn-helix domain-containing protein [Treponema sp.]|jgi:transcriptional regulator with XRE-family HTH domain|nr:helix-turn-helix domain-containing protein [Treponema sp.]